MSRKTALVLGIALLVCFVACGNNRKFDSAAWLKSDARERSRMCEDLVKSRILVGKSADEAQRLLGKADSDYGKALSYKIDMGLPFKKPEHYGLQVRLNSDRTVTEVKIVD